MKYNIFPVISATLGASYESGNWSNLSAFNIEANADSLKEEDFSPELTASLTAFDPTYEIAPFGLEDFKAYFKVPNKLDLTVQHATPNYSLKYKLDVEAGVKVKFWTGKDFDFSESATLFEKTVKEGNWHYNVGDTAFGGVIFYLDSTRRHGMVCALEDQSTGMYFWNDPIGVYPGGIFSIDSYGGRSTDGFLNDGAASYYSSNDIDSIITWSYQDHHDALYGKGDQYTDSIIAWSSGVGLVGNANYTFNVASVCKNYRGGGYTDWYLPSINEIARMYAKKDSIRHFTPTFYFSSSLGTGI